MSKKRIENYIPTAIKELQNEFGETIASSYNGYISSFGASIIQSGLNPTLALFENKNASTKEDKYTLTQIILKILDPESSETSLLKYVINAKEDEKYLKDLILDISIAIKLSIRTFKLEKGEQNE